MGGIMEFNMFNYLKLKGLDNSELAKHFEKIDETNENINSILEKNPGAIEKHYIRKVHIVFELL